MLPEGRNSPRKSLVVGTREDLVNVILELISHVTVVDTILVHFLTD